LVPRKAGPSKIKNKPSLLGMHIAEALGKAEFGLDVKRVPKRQQTSRNRSADQVRIAKAPLPSGLEVYEYVILMCEKLRSTEYLDRAISVALGEEIVSVPYYEACSLRWLLALRSGRRAGEHTRKRPDKQHR